ncbi:MAG: hypothetical protein HC923_11745, partial [Myxococcales bacterium]|nr:hypothetical protein [Myxococcales bacterium]
GRVIEADLVLGDARRAALPREPLVIYLFNPFDERAHREFAQRVAERLAASSEDLWVIQHKPAYRHAWSGVRALVMMEGSHGRVILKRREDPTTPELRSARP